MTQKTIKGNITLSGIGLHSGVESQLTLTPQKAGYGVKFKRMDVTPEKIIPADVKYVSSTMRGTNLKSGDVEIMTVEHLLSALVGLSINNVLIEINGPEVPILDGSAMPFVEALKEVGTEDQDEPVVEIEIDEVISYKDEETGAEIIAIPSETFEIETWIDYSSVLLGRQSASFTDLSDYEAEIAGARTFVLAEDLKQLADQGLIKGGDVDNAVVLMDKDFSDDELEDVLKKLGKSDIAQKIEDIKNGQKLLHENEMARHKILDLIGDLSLAGGRVKGRIIAKKPGHTVNIEFAKILREVLQKQKKLKGKPKYDPNKPALYQAEEIKSFLPHRYPFLLVDKILELSESHVVGVKNVTMNEQLFTGHFPDNPVFPGVLQMEALAQTGGILALNTVENPKQWDTYFLKMDSVKFKKMVLPGDTMILKMELLSPVRRGIVHMQGTVYVGDSIVSEGELTAQIVKRPD